MSKEAPTQTLLAASQGDASSVDQLFLLVFEELHARAEAQLRQERVGHTLQPTALVNEVYLRLIRAEDVEWRDRAHFFAVASRCIRRLLTDHARGKAASKRGDGALRVTLVEPDDESGG
ncbi:MAG: RNA polymerase subunit sigma-70, partial [Deltaproteobacteria bacterium]